MIAQNQILGFFLLTFLGKKLTNNGEWVRIIPSLTGMLYRFDGVTIDPIPVTAENLLKSSFKYSDNVVVAGGIEVRTYGVGFRTGTLFYECTQKSCTNKDRQDVDDVLVIERSSQIVRAVEPITGLERWNFSVGLHNIKLPQISCINTKPLTWNVSAVVPKGLLFVSTFATQKTNSWQIQLNAPIVRVWVWNGVTLSEVDLFVPKNIPTLMTGSAGNLPSLYIGMHNRQLYIHESSAMQNILQRQQHSDLMVAETSSLAKIPWKPISASAEKTEEDSTALSVLNNSEYVNGNGYYLQPDTDNGSFYCKKDGVEELFVDTETYDSDYPILYSYAHYYRDIFLLLITAILSSFLLRVLHRNQSTKGEIIIIEKPVEANITRVDEKELKKETFRSRYADDFETIRCLGQGGFGVVFEVKQNIDECHYAIKRITLPNESNSRDRVMREVKALAKLEHKNIVRYFCSWVEHPPVGWQEEHDKLWLKPETDGLTEDSMSRVNRPKSYSISIDIHLSQAFTGDDSSENPAKLPGCDDEDDDSFIIFANSEDEVSNKQQSLSEHAKKKINWKRPGRKHLSWDSSQNGRDLILNHEPRMYLYIQMQLCQKESLKEWLSLHRERNYEEVSAIFLQILDAVQYVHSSGLIHRDLKPSNIFFSLEGQIKVGDFGLVKDMESSFDLEHNRNCLPYYKGHTKEVGTQLYMCPEQFRTRTYDFKVDIYALGVILFELLVPFATEMERIKTLTNIKNQKYPLGFREKYPNEFVLLQNMLDVDPKKRLTTMEIKTKKPFNQITSHLPTKIL
ncbi:eukaryotic translation initiation factor 2-alpha kinase isoform X2 [Cylas formicarius]|uniref:eukaryotic translation initiation factor 2-alpha kinase isoform X2 n=1 Tax=Cylas formicarius TaxID=197179 RepID=UPI0029589AE0|nr:eukaryotic translation initiation factor 2-alpha kinase isoform X2 [Cylas formicarius]